MPEPSKNYDKMKKTTMALCAVLPLLFANDLSAQRLDKMQWFNEPAAWEIRDATTFAMQVPAKTDYWRITHYGFTVDDAPFYYATYGGEFEAKVKLTGDYRTTFDQMGLMLRADHEHWIKCGVEFVDGHQNVSAVVTHRTSDWSVVELERGPRSLWIRAVRRLDAVEISYSFDDKTYRTIRTCYLEAHRPVQVGLMAASPDGNGFEAVFEHFAVKPLPDLQRLEWAARQQ